MKLSDNVLVRIVQIVQESMLMGIDCADIMRQIDVVIDPDDHNQLVLSDEYVKMVREHHEKLVAEAQALAANRDDLGSSKIIVSNN